MLVSASILVSVLVSLFLCCKTRKGDRTKIRQLKADLESMKNRENCAQHKLETVKSREQEHRTEIKQLRAELSDQLIKIKVLEEELIDVTLLQRRISRLQKTFGQLFLLTGRSVSKNEVTPILDELHKGRRIDVGMTTRLRTFIEESDGVVFKLRKQLRHLELSSLQQLME